MSIVVTRSCEHCREKIAGQRYFSISIKDINQEKVYDDVCPVCKERIEKFIESITLPEIIPDSTAPLNPVVDGRIPEWTSSIDTTRVPSEMREINEGCNRPEDVKAYKESQKARELLKKLKTDKPEEMRSVQCDDDAEGDIFKFAKNIWRLIF